MRDLEIHKYIQYERNQGRNTRQLERLFDQARTAKQRYREAMRNVITLPPIDPLAQSRSAEAWKARATTLYNNLKQRIEEEVCDV
jgi:hypothetical protein